MNKNKTKSKYRLGIKIILCILYIVVMVILGFSAYRMYQNDREIISWEDVTTTEEYSYLEVSEMSESFAVIDDKAIHFAIEKKTSGEWKTFLIAIKQDDYNKYKSLIDYSYQRIQEEPQKVKVYGYAREINDSLKELAIKNIVNYLPFDSQVQLDNNNFEQYLSNVYFDSTLEQTIEPNYLITILLVMIVILFILLIFTLFDRDKLVDEVDNLLEVI